MRENSLRFAKGLSEAGSSVSSLDRGVAVDLNIQSATAISKVIALAVGD